MRDSVKVIIGFGSIWGLLAFGGVLFTSFTIGTNDTAPEVIAIALYGLTTLPACLLAIKYRRAMGVWLIILAALSAFGLGYQTIVHDRGRGVTFGNVAAMVFLSSMPGLIGWLLLRSSSFRKSGF